MFPNFGTYVIITNMKHNEQIQYFLIARNFGEIIYKISSNDLDDLKSKIKILKKEVEDYKLKSPIEGESVKEKFIAPDIEKAQGEI